MRNFIKSIVFTSLFIVFTILIGVLLLPWHSIAKYGLYKTAAYEVLWEKEDSIDAIFLGDSLIYNSISPMEIYNEYGFATYNCAEPAQMIKNSYEYLEAAIEGQHPKVVFFEANVLFRSPKYKPLYVTLKNVFKNIVPIYKYHNNWKKADLWDKYSKTSYYKGYKLSLHRKGIGRIKPRRASIKIYAENEKYFEKMIKLCQKNNIKLILVTTPSRNNWSIKRSDIIQEFAKKYNIEYLDLNNKTEISIDWNEDTKDYGEHLNYLGTKKVSQYMGNYLQKTNLIYPKRNDAWDKSYKKYQESFRNKILTA